MSYSNAIWKYISYDFFFSYWFIFCHCAVFNVLFILVRDEKKFKAWFMSLRNTLSLASIFGLCFPNLFKVNIRRMPTFTHGEIYFALSHLRYARRDMYLDSYIFRWKHYILRQLPSFTYLFPTEYIIFHWKISAFVFVHYKSSMLSKLVEKNISYQWSKLTKCQKNYSY